MVKKFFDGYCKTCRESTILNRLSETLYFLIGVSPHQADKRQPLDRFYLLMVLFSLSYMGGLAYGTIAYDSFKEWTKDLLTFILFTAYVASVVRYAILNEQRKRTETVTVKKRGGELIVYAWAMLTISLSSLVILTKLAYNDMITTLWGISVSAFATMITARAIRKSLNGEGNNNQKSNK